MTPSYDIPPSNLPLSLSRLPRICIWRVEVRIFVAGALAAGSENTVSCYQNGGSENGKRYQVVVGEMTQSVSPSPEELSLLRDVIGTFIRGGGRHPSSSPTLRWGVTLRDGFHVIDCMLTCIHSHDIHAFFRQLLPTALYMRSGDCPGPSRPEANPTCARNALFGAHAPPRGVTI